MITTNQAAEILGVSRCRILQLCEKKQLKAEKFGNAWAINEESVMERLKDGRVYKYRRKYE